MEREYTLGSGVKVYSYKNPALHGFYISLFVKAGSLYESEEENGITHFLEHIAIRNVNAIRNGQLYSELDEHGVDFNASTYSEMVQFYVSGAKENFSFAASVLTDILSPITLPPSEIEAERKRIRAEIREGDDKSSLVNFTSGIVFEGTPLARQITGSAKTVSRITKSRLEEYRKRVFCSNNIFFYVTGSFTDDDIRVLSSMIDSHSLPIGEARDNSAPVPEHFGKRGGAVHIKNADFTMARFTFDLDMSKMTMPEVDLIYDILLSGYSSDFFIELSEKRGLFYDISGSSERYKNIGALSFTFELKPGKLYEAIGMTVGILKDLKTKVLPENKCMKAGYVANADMLYDDFRELNFTFAYDNHIMDLGYSDISERKEAYKNVTPERLCELAREIFRPENLTLTVKGNKKSIDTERLRSIIASL